MKLIEVCDFIVDCPHSTANDEGEGYPLIRTPNVGSGRLILEGVHRVSEDVYNSRIQRGTPEKDDIILAREAPAGNVAIIKNEGKVCLGQRTVLIRPNRNKVVPQFLVYYLLAPEQQHKLKSSANGATVAHINMPQIRGLEISVPLIKTQQRIASILSAYDDLIENNQKQIKLLEEAAQRLYKEWFVDLRFPGYENVKVVDGVPEGWSRCRLTDILKICYGKDYKNQQSGNIPVYGSGGVMGYISKFLGDAESVLIPRKGSLNNIMYVNEKFWTIDTMFYTEPLEPYVIKFLYLFLRQIDMYNLNIGAAVPSMTTSTLSKIFINLPAENLRFLFDEKIRLIFCEISNLKKQIKLLKEARDRLLPKLMNGEIEV